MRKYAYIRVSTKEQNVDRQILALEPYHILKKIFTVITSQEKTLSVRNIRNCSES